MFSKLTVIIPYQHDASRSLVDTYQAFASHCRDLFPINHVQAETPSQHLAGATTSMTMPLLFSRDNTYPIEVLSCALLK